MCYQIAGDILFGRCIVKVSLKNIQFTMEWQFTIGMLQIITYWNLIGVRFTASQSDFTNSFGVTNNIIGNDDFAGVTAKTYSIYTVDYI